MPLCQALFANIQAFTDFGDLAETCMEYWNMACQALPVSYCLRTVLSSSGHHRNSLGQHRIQLLAFSIAGAAATCNRGSNDLSRERVLLMSPGAEALVSGQSAILKSSTAYMAPAGVGACFAEERQAA